MLLLKDATPKIMRRDPDLQRAKKIITINRGVRDLVKRIPFKSHSLTKIFNILIKSVKNLRRLSRDL